MSSWEGILAGLLISLQLKTLLFCFLGVLIGTLVGVLPGLGPVGACALLLPLTFGQDVTTALIMLCGIYYGAMYGGSTTSILVNVPGEAASVITCIDGHKMALQGRAGPALAISAIGSFIAGTMGVFFLMLLSPPLARAALRFGPPEYFAIGLFGLLLLSRLSGKSPLKAYAMMFAGVALSTIGVDPISGYDRFTAGSSKLLQGIDFMPVIMGLYGIGEVLSSLKDKAVTPSLAPFQTRDLIPSRKDMRDSVGPMFRGGIIGFFLGLIPGPAAIISTFVAYGLERNLSKHPEEFGNGAIAGVAGPESANNGATAGALVPLLSLGVPFSPMPAILLAGFMIHGVLPGPLLVKDHPTVFWGIIASMYIGNIMLLILNLPLVSLFARVALIPVRVLMPLVIIFCFLGAFAVRNNIFDLYVLVIFGVVGYLCRLQEYDPAPLVLGMIIGPMLENSLRQSMVMFGGDHGQFFLRPISAVIILASIIITMYPALRMGFSRLRRGDRTNSAGV
jgi:putative tricarboxylic transport membrane protein